MGYLVEGEGLVVVDLHREPDSVEALAREIHVLESISKDHHLIRLYHKIIVYSFTNHYSQNNNRQAEQ